MFPHGRAALIYNFPFASMRLFGTDLLRLPVVLCGVRELDRWSLQAGTNCMTWVAHFVSLAIVFLTT